MAGIASVENGKLGGRPKGKRSRKTLEKEAAQMYLIRKIEENIAPITEALLAKAKGQDVSAIKEAFDRAWGKVREKHDVNIHAVVQISQEVADKYDVSSSNTSEGSNG